MSRRLISALVLIAGVNVVLLLNAGGRGVSVSLGFWEPSMARAVAYFAFTVIGVIIGLLVK